MIGDVIYNLLSNDATVSGIVGTKIYPYMAFENVVYPYIVYEQTNFEPTDTKDGASELDVVSFDIEVYTKNPTDLTTLTNAVRDVLDRYSGTVELKDIDSIRYTGENTGYDLQDRVYLNVQNYSIRYKKSNLAIISDLAAVKNGSTQIDLSWSNITGNAGYRIERSQDLVTWSFLVNNATDTVTYSNTGLTVDNTYFYRVRAFDSNESTGWSNIVGISLTSGGTATVNVNGDLFNTVASGSTLNVPVQYVNGMPTGTIVGGVVEITNPITPSGIAYSRPTLTGQTTSYRTGDAAWVDANMPYAAPPSNPTHTATLVDFYTLANNNVFGNTKRFTDQSGSAAFSVEPIVLAGDLLTANTVIDHYTGLEWGVNNAQLGNNKNWTTCIDECLALNVQGFDDWYLPNTKEYFSVLDYAGNGLGQIMCFALGSRNLFSSNTYPLDTTRAMYISTIATSVSVAKTTTYNYYPVRRRY